MLKNFEYIKNNSNIEGGEMQLNISMLTIGQVAKLCALILRKYPVELDRIRLMNHIQVRDKYPKDIVYKHTNSKFGNMKEYNFIDIYRRRPLYMIRRVLKSMLPNNKSRVALLRKICILEEEKQL